MSYIYEALKRAQTENERAATSPRIAGRRAMFFGRQSRWGLWLVIGVIAANAFVLTAVIVRQRPSVAPAIVAPDVRSEVTSAVAPVAPVAKDAPVPEPATPTHTPPVSAPRVPPATVRVPAPLERANERRPPVAAKDIPVPEPVAPKHTPPVSAPRVPPATARVPAPIERAIERRPPSTVPAPVVPAPPAEATEPSAPMTAPTVTLQVIVYSDVPAQRMVFIDGRSYREGDAFDAETVLERIAADGIVMKRRGQRFVISNPRP